MNNKYQRPLKIIKLCKHNYRLNYNNMIIKIKFYNSNKMHYKKKLIMIKYYYSNTTTKQRSTQINFNNIKQLQINYKFN